MAPKFLAVIKMPVVDGKIRDELLERLAENARSCHDNELGTLKYAAFVPREDDGKTVWLVEEYADEEALNVHLASENVKKTNEWLQSASAFNADNSVAIHKLQYITNEFEFSRPEVESDSHGDPHVIFSELTYVPGGVEKATPFLKAVVSAGRAKEPGTLVYGVAKDIEKEGKLATFEIYESAEYLEEVHLPSDAMIQGIKNTEELRTGEQQHFLKKLAGFLYRL